MDLRPGLDGQPQNWKPVLPDLFRQRDYFLSESRTSELVGNLSRIG